MVLFALGAAEASANDPAAADTLDQRAAARHRPDAEASDLAQHGRGADRRRSTRRR